MSPVVASKLARLAADVADAALEKLAGTNKVGQVARQLAEIGIDLVGANEFRKYLTEAEASRIDREVDAEMEEKLRGQ